MSLLRRVDAGWAGLSRRAWDWSEAMGVARPIVADVQERGENALREHAERLGDLEPGGVLVHGRGALEAALLSLPECQRELLRRTARRIERFARAQCEAMREISVPVEGGRAGHTLVPVERAGCYAPGGRFPLPSSVLMTAIPAKVAGVEEVWVASPRPGAVTLAAAAVAGADAVLAAGGAQAIAALAYGAGPVPRVDVIVGPGNRYVTAAKQLVSGQVGIDMLAGPSELVVLADGEADARLIALDLLAQAEHDPDAMPVLVTTDGALIEKVERALEEALRDLPTAAVARRALANGCAVAARTAEEAVEVCNRIAPEHLQVVRRDASDLVARLRQCGALFLGTRAAEVLGDYGAGPNHVLPTGAAARFTGGLSVFQFLRVRTWLELEEGEGLDAIARDAAELARLEGLEAHARAAEARIQSGSA